jgi:RNA polymerase sigma-70 factor (ECF subfamily)
VFDEKNFKDLFGLYYVPLCYYSRKFKLDTYEAEEVVQRIFLKIWENRDHILIEKSISAYLYQSVRNESINFLKQKLATSKNQEKYEKRLRYANLFEAISEENGSSVLLVQELEGQINSAIEALPEKCREIFLLSRKENLSIKEIAEQLNISVNTVQSQISIALAKLRNFLSPYITVLIVVIIKIF